MASESVAASTTQPESATVNVVDARKPRELFSFSGSYSIHPETDSSDLLNDASCWLDAAMEIVCNAADDLTSPDGCTGGGESVGKTLWGAWHLMQMVAGAIEHAHRGLPKEVQS